MTPTDPDITMADSVHDLAGAYALHALPADERDAFEVHLDSCADCANEVDSLHDVAAELAELAGDEQPPAGLRASVLGAITSIEQERPPTARVELPTPGQDGPAATRTNTGAATDTDTNVISLDDHRRTRRVARMVTGIAAALALVAGGVGLWANGLNDQLQDRDQAIEQIATVLNAPDAQLHGANGASLVVSPSRQQAVFAAGTISTPDSSSVLQLWVIDDQGAHPAGLVDEVDRPRALDIPVPPGTAVGVTVEPLGGSDQPTTDPVAVFQT